jgi:hypothetical protein
VLREERDAIALLHGRVFTVLDFKQEAAEATEKFFSAEVHLNVTKFSITGSRPALK